MPKSPPNLGPEFIDMGGNSSVKSLGLGVFDGLHRGHQEIAKHCDSLLTFYPHPDFVLGRIASSTYITTLDELKCLFSNLFILRFSEEIASLQPKAFLDDIITRYFSPQKIVVGYDYHFGYKGQGDTFYLKQWGAENNCAVDVVTAVDYKGKLVKSGLIRRLILSGDFDEAVDFLGHPYLICGKVIRGKGLGRTLGFPTANLEISAEKLLPNPAVYKGSVVIDGISYKALTHIGSKPTFMESQLSVEVHIPGLSQDLYDLTIRVELTSKIRGIQAFPSKEALIQQIQRDMEALYDN